MKNHKKIKGLILGLLTFVAFTLASCQKEEITEHALQTKVEPKLKIVKLTNNEITENKGIAQKLDFFTETLKTRQQNKTVYSSEHDFYINTDFATYIEKPNGSHSYTFAVQYAEETGEINNLVLHSQTDGSYKAIYLSYDVTENEKELINQGLSVNLEGKISYAIIDDSIFIDTLFSKVTTYDECLVADYSVGPCNAGYTYEHGPEPFAGYSGGMCSGSTQTLVSVGYDMDCINDVDNNTSGDGNNSSTGNPNGNPNDSSSNNGTTNGGTNLGGDNDPITTPVTCEGCPPIEEEDICLNSLTELPSFTPEMSAWLLTQSQSIINQLEQLLQGDNCSEQSQEQAINVIYVLMENPEANPLLLADCRSFEFAKPPGVLQRSCAVVNFNNTFHTAGIRSNGSPYYGEIDVPIDLIYFTMPAWMTNGQAANITAEAVNNAMDAADYYFIQHPDISALQLRIYFLEVLEYQLSVIGGSFSTTAAPFNIPSPAPYLKTLRVLGDPYDC